MYTPHPDAIFQSAHEYHKDLLNEAKQHRLAHRSKRSLGLSRLLQPVMIRLADTLIASGQRLKASF